jgi:hypothetical protein
VLRRRLSVTKRKPTVNLVKGSPIRAGVNR